MRSDASFATRPAVGPAIKGTDQGEALTLASGVQWLGVPAERRPDGTRVAQRLDTAVLGTAHGPRLLELVCSAG